MIRISFTCLLPSFTRNFTYLWQIFTKTLYIISQVYHYHLLLTTMLYKYLLCHITGSDLYALHWLFLTRLTLWSVLIMVITAIYLYLLLVAFLLARHRSLFMSLLILGPLRVSLQAFKALYYHIRYSLIVSPMCTWNGYLSVGLPTLRKGSELLFSFLQ